MRGSRRKARRIAGFTFVEVLAALMFLGILIPVVIGALTVSNRASVIAERSAIAAQLAENRLNELIVDESAGSAGSGDFGNAWPGYRWQLTTGDWQSDTMTELTMSVFFPVQGKEHEVRLTTLQSPSSTSL